ncbi:MAG: hypothetical protein ACREAK_00310 [Nitrosarchaeum sp.]
MVERKTSKLFDIRETASDAVEIMRHIGTPEVRESLSNVKETVAVVNEIIQSLKAPEMVKNIENFRLISENMNKAATKMQNTMQELKETGVIDKASELMAFAKGKIDSFGDGGENSINGKDLHNVSVATKEMFVSIRELVNELTETVASAKKSGTICNVQETIKEASEIYKTVVSSV